MLAQADELILTVIEVLEGVQETEIVRLLLRLRDSLDQQEIDEASRASIEAAARGVDQHREQLLLRKTDGDAHDQSVHQPDGRPHVKQITLQHGDLSLSPRSP